MLAKEDDGAKSLRIEQSRAEQDLRLKRDVGHARYYSIYLSSVSVQLMDSV